MTGPVDNANQLAECLARDEPLPDDVKVWLASGLTAWQSGVSLPDAFGIYDNVSERKARRDQAIRDYAKLLPQKSRTGRAKAISYQVLMLRQNRRDTSEILREIDALHPIPESVKQISRILSTG